MAEDGWHFLLLRVFWGRELSVQKEFKKSVMGRIDQSNPTFEHLVFRCFYDVYYILPVPSYNGLCGRSSLQGPAVTQGGSTVWGQVP